MNKLIAVLVASLMLLPVVASISPTVTGIVPLWNKEWESEPDDNWVSDKVRIPDENDYQFGMTDIGVDYSRHMAVSDNGMYAAINFAQSGPGITINEYEVTAGETFQGEGHIKDAAISDDGRYFAQANDGGATRTLRFFDTSEPEPLWSYDYSGEVNGVDISSDGEWTAICLRQNFTGHLISREFETIKTVSFGAGKSCKSVDISDDGSKVAFAWTDDATVGEFGVYDMDLNQIWTNTSVQHAKLHVKLNHDGSRLFIGTKSDAGPEPEATLYDATGTLLWGVDSDRDSQFVRYSQGQTLGPTFSDVDYFLNSDNNNFLHMYNGGSSTPIWSEGPFTGSIFEGEFSDNASVLATVVADGGLYVYNNPGHCSVTCEPDAAIQLPGAPTSAEISVDVSPDGTTIIASGGSGGGHEYVMLFTDGGNGWDQSDMDPIWAREDDSEDVLVANGIFAYASADDETIRYGKVPIYTQSYDHDTPIDTVWDGSDYSADYKALGDLHTLYLLDEGSGGNPIDSSGNGYDLVGYTGGTTTLADPHWTTGKIGGGIFNDDNEDSWAKNGEGEGTGLFPEMTAAIWAKVDLNGVETSPSFNTIYGSGWAWGGGVSKTGFVFGSNSNYYNYELATTDGVTTVVNSNNYVSGSTYNGVLIPANHGEWVHLAVVFDGNAKTVSNYINGVLIETEATTYGLMGQPYSVTPGDWGTDDWDRIVLGARTVGGYEHHGELDEAVVYADVLTSAEIASLYAISQDRIEASMVGYWHMDEGTGTTTADDADDNDGTLMNGPTWDTGYFGESVVFDGSNDFVTVGEPDSMDFIGTETGFTLSAWVKIAQGEQGTIISKSIDTNGDRQWQLFVGGSAPCGTIGANIGGQEKSWNTPATMPCMTNDEWHHVLLKNYNDGGTFYFNIWVDGVMSPDGPWASGSSDNNGQDADVLIGARENNAGGQDFRWTGSIDEVQVWSRGLSADEIEFLYGFQYHGSPSGMASAQEGRFLVSRTSSGEGGGGLAFFDTLYGAISAPNWTADVGAGNLVAMSDNANPIIIVGNNDNSIQVFNSAGVEKFSYTLSDGITSVSIEDDNSYAYASSLNHHTYGWDLSRIADWDTYTSVLEGFEFDHEPARYWKLDETSGTTATDETGNYDGTTYGAHEVLAYWKLDENIGLTVTDVTGNGHDGTINGATWATGKYDSGLEFDGTAPNNEVNFGDSDLFTGLGELTGCWWQNEGDNTGVGRASTLAKDGEVEFHTTYNTADSLSLSINNHLATFSHASTKGVWQHICMQWDGYDDTRTLYVDGSLEATLSVGVKTGTIDNTGDPLGMGWRIGNSYFIYEGKLDEFQIWGGLLNPDEISEVYNDRKANFSNWDTTAKYDGGLKFDGIDDYVAIGSWDSGPAMSISAWFKSDWTGGTDNILGRYYGMDSWNVKEVGGEPRLSVRPYTGGLFRDIDCYGFEWGEWQHAVLTGDGTTFTLYMNGLFCGTSTQDGTFDAAGYTWELGIDGSSTTTNLFEGEIDEVIFYDTTLSSARVAQLYASRTTEFTDTDLLEGAWFFEEGSGEITTDITGNGHDGTLTNGPVWTDGKFGEGATLIHNNGIIEIGDGSMIDDQSEAINRGWTAATWVKTSDASALGGGGLAGIMTKGWSTDLSFYCQIVDTGIPNCRTFVNNHAAGSPALYQKNSGGTFAIDDDSWHHIALAYDNKDLRFYVDGLLQDTDATGDRVDNTATAFAIGNWCGAACGPQNYGLGQIDGSVDEAVLYYSKLDATDIATLYAASHSGHPSTPAWDFWAGGEVASLDSEDGLVAMGTSSGELIVLNSAGVEQWRRTLDGPVDFVTFHNGRVVADTDDTTSTINMFNDAHASFYFKYGQPKLLYLFDELDGTIAYDSSGYGNDGTFTGSGSDSFEGGQIGNSLDINDGDDLEQPVNFAQAIPREATVSTWFKVSSTSWDNEQLMIDAYASGTRWRVYTCDDGDSWPCSGGGQHIEFFEYGDNAQLQSQELQSDVWYNTVITFDGSTYSMYMNGLLTDTHSASGDTSGLGADVLVQLGASDFDGSLDEFAIWDRAFSSAEVADMYGGIAGHVSSVQDGLEGHWTLDFDADDDTGTYGASTLSGFGTDGYWSFFEGTGTLVQDLSGTGKDGNTGGEFSASGFWTMDGASIGPELIGYWMLDETSGAIAYDSSGYGNDGTLTNGVWTTGKFGGALDFQGDAGIEISPPNENDLSYDFSLCMWSNTDTLTSEAHLFHYNSPDPGHAYTAYFQSNKLWLAMSDSTPVSLYTAAVSTGVWEHYCFVITDSTRTIYVNGVSEVSDTFTGYPSGAGTFTIGAQGPTPLSNFGDGRIDEFALFDGALSQREVSNIYNSRTGTFAYDYSGNANHGTTNSFEPIGHWKLDGTNMPAPVGYWNFDEGSGVTAADSTLYANDGTLTNSPTWDTDGKYGSSLEFDSSSMYVDAGDVLPADDFTVSLWFKASPSLIGTPQGGFFDMSSSNSRGMIYMQSSERPIFYTGSNNYIFFNSMTEYYDDEWHNMVFYMAGANRNAVEDCEMYIDGEDLGVYYVYNNGDAESYDYNSFRIGKGYSTVSPLASWVGGLDEVSIFDGGLFPDEILSLYENGLPNFVYDSSANANHGDVTGQVLPVGHWKMNENTGTEVYDYGTGGNDGTVVGLDAAPVGYWKLDEEVGTTAVDSSGNGHDGTHVNSPTPNFYGYYDWGLEFDGADDVVDIPHHSDFDIVGDLTMAAWINMDVGGTFQPIISKGGGSCNNVLSPWQMRIDDTDKLEFVTGDGTTANRWSGNQELDLGWNHVAVTVDEDGTSSIVYYYVNGELDHIKSGSWSDYSGYTPANDVALGSIDNVGSCMFVDGTLDDVLIYDAQLTHHDIMHLYNAQKGVHNELIKNQHAWSGSRPVDEIRNGPVGHWTFDEGTGLPQDSSPNGNHVITTGSAPVWGEGVSGYSGVDFDGVDDYYVTKSPPLQGSTDFTVSFWYKGSDIDVLIHNADSGCGSYSGWQIQSGGTDARWKIYQGGTAYSNDALYVVDWDDGSWHHMVWTQEHLGRSSWYLDGVLEETTDSSYLSTVDYDMCIDGGLKFGSNLGDYATGSLDEVSIWDQALTQKDVNELYSSRLENHPELIGYWKLDENTGTTAADVSGNGNDGTVTGATWDAGYFGSGLDFDGVNDYVDIPDDAALKPDISKGLTISQWINHNGAAGSQSVVTKMGQYATEIWATDDCGGWFWLNGGTASVKSSDGSCTQGEWHHFAITMNTETCTRSFYLNGELKDSSTSSPCVLSNTADATYPDLQIGRWSGTAQVVDGLVDDVAIIAAPLSASEIEQLYNSQKNEHAPLIAYWAFDDGSGTTPVDSSGNNYDAEFGNNPSWTVASKVGSGALNFDGLTNYVAAYPSIDKMGGYSVSLWAKDDDIAQNGGVFASAASGGNDYQDGLTIRANGGDYQFANGATNEVMAPLGGGWTHLAVVYSVNAVSWYANGELVGWDTAQTTLTDITNICIGARHIGSCGTQFFEGNIDDVALWDRALTAGEVSDLFDQRRTTFGPEWTDGASGSGLSFDGDEEFVDLGDMTSMDGETELTIAAWVYRTGYNQHLTAIMSKDGSFEAFITAGNWDSKRWLMLSICGENVEFASTSVPLEEWTHVTYTWVGGGSDTRKAYLNGVLSETMTTGTKTALCSNSDHVGIGARAGMLGAVGGYGFPGTLDEVLLYDVALSDSEIAELYNSKSGEYTPPVGQWLFDENTGTDAYDSGYSGGPMDNDGTISGASWVDGYDGGGGGDGGGWALDFDGVNDNVEIANNPLAAEQSTGVFTVSGWFKTTETTNDNMLWSRSDAWGDDGACHIFIGTDYLASGSGNINARCKYGGTAHYGTEIDADASLAVNDGEWHHVAATWDIDTNDVYLYVDGNLAHTVGTAVGSTGCGGAYNCAPAVSNSMWIASRGSGNWFEGTVDEFAVYDRALSGAEIEAIINDRELGPVGYWSFNEGQGIYTYGTDGLVGEFDTDWDGKTTWVDGVVGSGIHFGGTGEGYTSGADVSISDEPYNGGGASARIDNGYFEEWTELSFSGWVKADFWGSESSGNAANCIVCKDGSSGERPFEISHSWNKLIVKYNGNEINYAQSLKETGMPAGKWHHIAVTWDGSISRLYINGELATGLGEAAWAETLELSDNPLTFGESSRYEDLSNFVGSIDEFYIYERGISYEEVTELYRAGIMGKTEFSAEWDRGIYGNSIVLENNNYELIQLDNNAGCATSACAEPDTGQFSVSAWYRVDDLEQHHRFISKDGGFVVQYWRQAAGDFYLQCGANQGSEWDNRASWGMGIYATKLDKEWHHITCTFGADNKWTLYFDGELVDKSSTVGAMPTWGSDFWRFGYYSGWWSIGAIDDIMMWDVGLSANDVLDNYNAQQGVYSIWGGPLHLLSFNDVTNGGIGATTWENDGSASWDASTPAIGDNDPQWTEYGVSGGAIQFDAADDYLLVCQDTDANCEPSGDAGTIATWFRTETGVFPTSGTPPIVNYYTDASNGVQLKVYANFGQQRIQLFIEDPDYPGGQAFVDCLVDGEAADLWNIGWNHIAGTWAAGEEMRLYLNGVECGYVEGEHDITPPSLTYGDLYVAYEGAYGAWGIGGAEPMSMDELAIYEVALSPDDVSRLYDTHRTEFGPDWVEDGYHNSALEFDGGLTGIGANTAENDYVDIDPGFTISNEITVAMWIKPDSNVYGNIIQQGDPTYVDGYGHLGGAQYSGNEWGWVLRLGDDEHLSNNANAVTWMSSDDSGNYNADVVVQTAANTITAGEWQHIAVTKKNCVVEIYINGVLSTSDTMVAPSSTNCAIAASGGGAMGDIRLSWPLEDTYLPGSYGGLLDDLVISNQWMNGDRITDLYNAQMGVVEPVAYWSMDGGVGTHVHDGITQPFGYWGMEENTGSAVGDTVAGNTATMYSSWTTSGYRGNALEFDGSNDYLQLPSAAGIVSDKTFSAWYKMDTNQDNFLISYDSIDAKEMKIEWDSGSGCWYIDFESTTTFCPGYDTEWHHIVVTDDMVQAVAYFDGVPMPYTAAGTLTGDAGVEIGGRTNGADMNFDGIIDEITLWDVALTWEEIQYLYGAGTHGVMTNGPVWVDGVVGGAMHFDGVDDYVTISSTETDELNFGGGDFTLCGWFKMADPLAREGLAGKGYYVYASNIGYGLGTLSGGWIFQANDGTTNGMGANTPITTAWTHVCGQVDGTNRNIYVDGVLDGTDTNGGLNADISTNFVLGARTPTKNFFEGEMDEVAIYDVALTPTQINDLYLGMRLNYHADWVDGKYGGGMEFHGDDYVEITNAGLEYANEDVTLSAWVTIQDNDVDNYYPFMFLGDGADGNPHIMIAKSRGGYAAGKIYLELNDGTSSMTRAQSSDDGITMPGEGWIHVVGVVDDTNSEIRLYIDGQLDDTQAYPVGWSWDLSTSTDFKAYIGWNAEAAYHEGDIDSAIVFNAALSDSDVLDLYNDQRTTFTVDQTPGHLSGGYEFDGNDVITLDTPITDQDDLSMFIWVKPYDASPSEQGFAVFSGGQNGIATGSGSDTLRIKHETVDTSYTDTTYSWIQNEWQHVGFTWDGATINVYANGELVNTAPLVDTTGDGFELSSGLLGSFPSLNWPFNGELDDFAIYDRALTDDEVQSIFMKSQARLQSGLVGFWNFNDGTGVIATDNSGNGNTGTLTNGAYYETDGKISYRIVFDGTDDYVYVPVSDYNNVATGTINAWIRPDDFGDHGYVVSSADESTNTQTLTFGNYKTSGLLRFTARDDSIGTDQTIVSTNPLQVDVWQMVTVTSDGSTIRMFINGVAETTAVDAGSNTGAWFDSVTGRDNLVFGSHKRVVAYDNLFDGDIDEVSIWNRALTVEEIYELSRVRSYDDEDSGLSIFTSDGELINEPDATTYNDALIDDDGTILLFDDSNNIEAWQTTNTRAALFNGPDYVNFGDVLKLTSDEITMSAWFNTDTVVTAERTIVGKWSHTGTGRSYLCELYGDEILFALSPDGTSGTQQNLISATNTIQVGQWHHVACIADGTNMIIYIDGVNSAQIAYTDPIFDVTSDLKIGDYGIPSSSHYFEGIISDVRIYDETLTLAEVTILAGKNPMLTGNYWSLGSPVGWWKLDEDYTGGATTAIDYGSGGNDGTDAGDIETFYNGMTPRYAAFDGVNDAIAGLDDVGTGGWDEATLSCWFYIDEGLSPSGESVCSTGWTFTGGASWNYQSTYIGVSTTYIYFVAITSNHQGCTTDPCVWPDANYEKDSMTAVHGAYPHKGKWTHVALTFEDSVLKGYVDGVYVNERIFTDHSELNWPRGASLPSTTVPTWNTLDVGRSTSGGTPCECLVADARLYDTALSSGDLAILAGTNPVETGTYAETSAQPMVWYKLNGNADDSSANERDASETGGMVYQSTASNSAIFNSGTAITGASIDDGMIIAAEFQKVDIYDSMGNGWHANDGNPSWSLGYTDDIGVVHRDGITTAWGTGGKTYFKAPGIHPVNGNLIVLWDMTNSTPIAAITPPYSANNATFWAGEVVLDNDGNVYVQSRMDFNGDLDFVLYKFNSTGKEVWNITTHENQWLRRGAFMEDSRSSMDVAPNGTTIAMATDEYLVLISTATGSLQAKTSAYGQILQVEYASDTQLVIATSINAGATPEFYSLNATSLAELWSFNADVDAFQIDCSKNSLYCVFTNGDQMAFAADSNNTLFQKGIPDVKASAVGNNGKVALASSTKGWFIFNQDGATLASGGVGQRVYDIDIDNTGEWMAVTGYDPAKGTAWMEIWALSDSYNYDAYTMVYLSEKTSDGDGDSRAYRVMFAEGSTHVIWGWSSTDGDAGAEMHTLGSEFIFSVFAEEARAWFLYTVIMLLLILVLLSAIKRTFKQAGMGSEA